MFSTNGDEEMKNEDLDLGLDWVGLGMDWRNEDEDCDLGFFLFFHFIFHFFNLKNNYVVFFYKKNNQ